MQVTEKQEEWIGISEASQRFKLSRQAIYDAISRGIIHDKTRELGFPKRLVDAKEIERKMQPRSTTERD